MSDSFYTNLSVKALKLLTKRGMSVTITRKAGADDPVTGADNSGSDLSKTFTAINPPVKDFNNSLLPDGTLISNNFRYLVVAAYKAPFVPAVDDVVTLNGSDYVIEGVTPISPAGIDLVYKLVLRV